MSSILFKLCRFSSSLLQFCFHVPDQLLPGRFKPLLSHILYNLFMERIIIQKAICALIQIDLAIWSVCSKLPSSIVFEGLKWALIFYWIHLLLGFGSYVGKLHFRKVALWRFHLCSLNRRSAWRSLYWLLVLANRLPDARTLLEIDHDVLGVDTLIRIRQIIACFWISCIVLRFHLLFIWI